MKLIYSNKKQVIGDYSIDTGYMWLDKYILNTAAFKKAIKNKSIQLADDKLSFNQKIQNILNYLYGLIDKEIDKLKATDSNLSDLNVIFQKINYTELVKQIDKKYDIAYLILNINDDIVAKDENYINKKLFFDKFIQEYQKLASNYNNKNKVDRELRLVRHIGALVDSQVLTNYYRSGRGNSYSKTNRSWWWHG